MNAGFSVCSADRHVQFALPPAQAEGRSLVSCHRTPEGAAVLRGRLYYRPELLARLRGRVSAVLLDAAASCDAALALAAYAALGQDGLTGLEGDFAVVVHDAQNDLLLACRDPFGGYPLYWARHREGLAVGTGLRALLDVAPHTTLDREYLAELLMLPSSWYHEVPSERCPYAGIQRLRAGTLLRAQLRSGQVDISRCWDWLERVGTPRVNGLEEAGEKLAALLRQAVRERQRGTTACHLSGGMDSTAVALLARDNRQDGPVYALSLVYDRLNMLARETPYLDSVLQEPGAMTVHRLPGDELLDFDSYSEPPPHDEPWPWLHRAGMEAALLDAAARAGATTVLTGTGADELLEGQPYHLTKLLRRGHWCAAWREAARWARARTCSIWSILGPYGLAHVVPSWLRVGVGPLLRGGYASWRRQNDYTIAPWIRPEFSRRYELRRRGLDHVRQERACGSDPGLSATLAALAVRTGDLSRWHVAAPHGIVQSHPFLDPRVVTYCLSLQATREARCDRSKPVLAEAMRGVLPDNIRRRFRKGHFNEVYYRGLARNLPALEALVEESPDELDLFDKPVLLQCLQQTALGIGRDVKAADRLNLSLALLKWLSVRATPNATEGVPCRPGAAL